jgi:Two component regulator propeller
MEDKTGKLWFGTRGEACFYDGKTFTVLKNKDGKAFKNVWSIIEDKKGNIWLGDSGYDLLAMAFGAMTAEPLLRYRRGGLMLLSKIKKETSGLPVL